MGKGLVITAGAGTNIEVDIDVPLGLRSTSKSELYLDGSSYRELSPSEKERRIKDKRNDFLSKIKEKVIFYQDKLIGTKDAHELQRYKVNAEVANGIIRGDVDSRMLEMFTLFFNSVKESKSEKFSGFTVEKFSKWILVKQSASKSGVLLIGSIANKSERRFADAVSDADLVVSQFSQSAEDVINKVTLLAIAQMYKDDCIDSKSMALLESSADDLGQSVDDFILMVSARD